MVRACLTGGRRRSKQREAKAASFSSSPRTLSPDVSAHRFCQLLPQIETQAGSWHRPSKIALETHKLSKEQGKFISGNAWSRILDTDLHLCRSVSSRWRRLTQRRTDDHGGLLGAILQGVRKQMAQDLAHRVRIGPDGEVFRDLHLEIIGLRLAWIQVVKHVLDDVGN